jgi:hypothetical protein
MAIKSLANNTFRGSKKTWSRSNSRHSPIAKRATQVSANVFRSKKVEATLEKKPGADSTTSQFTTVCNATFVVG